MAESALTVVPSRSEAFGLVVIESMAVGTPAVASAVGGIPEIIRDGVDGFLVPPDDPAALADKIGLLLSNAELRHKMGLNARERFLSRFEQSRVVKEQADWLEQIVAAGRSSTIGRSS
jgi:glycosyltransferase involved in cell wall biosynthesis